MDKNDDFFADCDYYGCIYNEHGRCEYKNAPIKRQYMMACRDEYDNGDYD